MVAVDFENRNRDPCRHFFLGSGMYRGTRGLQELPTELQEPAVPRMYGGVSE